MIFYNNGRNCLWVSSNLIEGIAESRGEYKFTTNRTIILIIVRSTVKLSTREAQMRRLYDTVVRAYFEHYEEMLFLSGPRQVGKTTTSKSLSELGPYYYFNWDDEDHRAILLEGPAKVIETAGIQQLTQVKPIIAFDEIHKRPDWKNFLKGFFDTYKESVNIIVTGSARLDIYKKGGDSLMGRYFPYRMHPVSVAEIARTHMRPMEIAMPYDIGETQFSQLLKFGGYPKPYLQHNQTFSNRWQQLRKQQLLQEDIRDVNVIHDLHRLELLMEILQRRASHPLTYSNLAKQIRVSVDTIIRWLEVLQSFYYCYLIRPWSRNIARALVREPKVFLWDWSVIHDPGARAENFIASHLLKAVEYWTDLGLGHYNLYYIRDVDQHEVDFIVTKNDEPWFLVEAKNGNKQSLNPNLARFQKITGASHAFQVVMDAAFVNKDCFTYHQPVIVPAKTLLSQFI